MIKDEIVSASYGEANYHTKAVCVDVAFQSGKHIHFKSIYEYNLFKALAKRPDVYSIGYEAVAISYGYKYADNEGHWQYKPSKYIPDFIVNGKRTDDGKHYKGILIEGKGFWDNKNRRKYRDMHKQHPKLMLYFMLAEPNLKYYMRDFGFKYGCGTRIPGWWFSPKYRRKFECQPKKGGVIIE